MRVILINFVVTIALAQSAGRFTPTGRMIEGRLFHTSTLLNNGKVLIAGGEEVSNGERGLSTAELYDPVTGSFAPTANMMVARAFHTATLLPDGKVLIAGGLRDLKALSSAELYDPDTGTFKFTGNMTMARDSHTATLLQNGKVLIAGGRGSSGPFFGIATAEIYDPVIERFAATGQMTEAWFGPAAAPLLNGTGLIASACDKRLSAVAEIYDPLKGTFSHATLLTNGKVLIVGGVAMDIIGDEK